MTIQPLQQLPRESLAIQNASDGCRLAQRVAEFMLEPNACSIGQPNPPARSYGSTRWLGSYKSAEKPARGLDIEVEIVGWSCSDLQTPCASHAGVS